MANVTVVLRKNKADRRGMCPLRIRMSHEGDITEINLKGVKIDPKYWDSRRQAVTNDPMLTLRIQNEILKYQKKINQVAALDEELNLNEIKGKVDKRSHSKTSLNITEYIKQNFETRQSLAYGTRKNYRSCRKRIEEYRPKTRLTDIDADWLRSFELWLKNEYKLADWTVNTRMKIVKRVVNDAFENRLISRPNFAGYLSRKGRSDRKFVTPQELKQLEMLTPGSMTDQNILRSFLFCCYAGGMRFSDACVLTYRSITQEFNGEEYEYRLRYQMRKTSKQMDLHLNSKALMQINVQECGSDNLVFDLLRLSDLKLDEDGVRKRIESRNAYVNKRLKLLCESAGLKRTFSFHESRHSFFCNGLQLGIDLMSLKEVGGHSDVRVTQGYLQVVDQKKRNAMKMFDLI